MKTKQIVMTSAHAIYKMQNVTFSEALEKAWILFKDGYKAIVMKCNRLVKSVGLGYETVYFDELSYRSIVTQIEVVDNSGARHDYGIGAYNGD